MAQWSRTRKVTYTALILPFGLFPAVVMVVFKAYHSILWFAQGVSGFFAVLFISQIWHRR